MLKGAGKLKKGWIKEIVEWVVCFIIAYAIYLIINYFIGTIAGVKQASMYPTCKDGDRVIISRRTLFNKKINKGDIVIVEAPIDVEEKQNEYAVYENKTGMDFFTYNIMGLGKKSYIKRVIATGGDHIYISETGEVYINDELQQEEYLTEGLKTPRLGDFYDVIVPEGYAFLMGDNRKGSKDSREFGIVPLSKIEGKVWIRIWPLNKIGKI